MAGTTRALYTGRRDFLRTVGLVAGSLVAGASPAVVARTAHAERMSTNQQAVKVGLLVPRSKVYPYLHESFINGVQLSLDQAAEQVGRRRVQFVIEMIGASPSTTQQKAEKLISADQVDLIIGVMGPSTAGRLRETLEQSQTVGLIADGGANVPRETEESPYLYYSSLGAWQASWGMGRWAAANLGGSSSISTSFYEAGYDNLYAFRQGFESAGGRVLGTHVTHGPNDLSEMGSALAGIADEQPDFVFGLYSGQEALEFVYAYANSELAHRIPLAGSGSLVHEGFLSAMGEAAVGIMSAATWTPALQTPSNEAFGTAYQARTQYQPDAFAVLGYDVGHLVVAALDAINWDARQKDGLRKALQAAVVESPRGELIMDAHTHTATTAIYVRQVQRIEGKLINGVVAEMDGVPLTTGGLRELWASPRTGWLNAYLSA
jgi:branched-chain amino acid transport system substrate-binding protein